jgi:hypothetical protein
VLAGNLFGIPLRGTHSHAFVSSYMVSELSVLLLTTDGFTIAVICSVINLALLCFHAYCSCIGRAEQSLFIILVTDPCCSLMI